MKTGIELIAEERARQISQEGWTPEHDNQHRRGELAHAAVGYASLAAYQSSAHLTSPATEMDPHPQWPWDADWWKPSASRIRNLQKAGALIAAEIDRLQRLR
jgi:hypothetical protein